MQRGQGTKDSGRMTSSMARELKSGMKDHSTKGSTSWERKKEVESTHGLMARRMMVNGLIIGSTERVSISGKMEEGITGNGRTMTWKAWECTIGQTDVVTRASIITTRSAAMAFITGQTADSTKAGGTRGNSTVLASIWTQRKRR